LKINNNKKFNLNVVHEINDSHFIIGSLRNSRDITNGMIYVPLHVGRVITQMTTFGERFALNNGIMTIIP